MKAYKGSKDHTFKRRKFLKHRSTTGTFCKRQSNRRIRRMKDDGEKFPNIPVRKLQSVLYLIIIGW